MRSLVERGQTLARMRAVRSESTITIQRFRGPDAPYRSTSPQNTATAAWFPASCSTDEALLGAMGTLRDQSRDLDRNEGLARGAVENFGPMWSLMVRPQSRVDHKLLGVSEKKARKFEQMAETIFDLHTGSDATDFHGRASFPQMQGQVLRAAFL